MPASPIDSINQIEHFLVDLKTKGASSNTVSSYGYYLRDFVKWYTGVHLNELKFSDISKYRKYLSKRKLSTRSQSSYLTSLRTLLKWLGHEGYVVMDYNNIILPKIKSKSPKFVQGSQMEQIIKAVKTDRIIGKRDKAVLEILLATGIRVSELVNLNRKDIDLEAKTLIIRTRKQERSVSLSSRAFYFLVEYLAARQDGERALFIGYKGRKPKMRISPRSIQRLVKKYAHIAGMTLSVTPRIFRSSFTVDLAKAGESIEKLQKILGHKHKSTTLLHYPSPK